MRVTIATGKRRSAHRQPSRTSAPTAPSPRGQPSSPPSSRRRPTSATSCSSTRRRGEGISAQRHHARQRRSVQGHPAERAGGDQLQELRRQEHPGLDPEAAGLRRGEEYPLILEIHGGPHAAYGNVYTHEFQWMAAKGYVVLFTNPRGSTRTARTSATSSSTTTPATTTRILMAGVDEVLKKGYVDAEPARRHRRQRRRAADQLDDHADAALQGRRLAARHRRLVRLLVHRRLHAVPADLVPQGAVGGSAGLRGALADHPRRERHDAADARRTATPTTARRPPTAAR